MKRMLTAVASSMRRILPSLIFCVLLTTPLQAQQPGNNGVRLSFVRAENAAGCIAAPTLQSEIIRRMGYDPFDGAARQWIEGFIQRQSDYFELQLFERDAQGQTLGTRRLREQAGDCHKLDEAIVLAIALIIDPTVQLAPAVPSVAEPKPTASGTPAASSVPTSESPWPRASAVPGPSTRDGSAAPVAPLIPRESAAPTQQESGPTPGAAFVAADAVAVGGVLPGVAFGAELSTRVALDRRERFALRVSGLYLPQERQSTEAGDLGFSLNALEAGACVSTPPRGATMIGFGCTGFGLGAVHTVVHSPQPWKPDDRLWAAFRFEIGGSMRVAGPVWLGVRLFDLVAPRLWDFRVVINDRPVRAFAQKALMPGAAVGLGLHFD